MFIFKVDIILENVIKNGKQKMTKTNAFCETSVSIMSSPIGLLRTIYMSIILRNVVLPNNVLLYNLFFSYRIKGCKCQYYDAWSEGMEVYYVKDFL